MLAVLVAEHFVRALPSHIPMPDFTVDPDGDVSLNWTTLQKRRLTLSVSASQRIAFAWLDGIERGYGVAVFDGLNVPSRILSELDRFAYNGNASLRTA